MTAEFNSFLEGIVWVDWNNEDHVDLVGRAYADGVPIIHYASYHDLKQYMEQRTRMGAFDDFTARKRAEIKKAVRAMKLSLYVDKQRSL